jgi:hypothetical protein
MIDQAARAGWPRLAFSLVRGWPFAGDLIKNAYQLS